MLIFWSFSTGGVIYLTISVLLHFLNKKSFSAESDAAIRAFNLDLRL